MRRALMLLGVVGCLALTGCGLVFTAGLCASQVVDCSNGKDVESAQEAKK